MGVAWGILVPDWHSFQKWLQVIKSAILTGSIAGAARKIFRKDLSSFMPKFEDNQSVMNPNLVYFCLMHILCAMSGGPKVGVSNERFSAKVKLRCKLDIHTALLSPPFYLRRRVGLQCFQGLT